jgi:predicted Fe-Mo cluster-binding NifX family protein
MKIAIITENGQTISDHFGRARGFVVVTTGMNNELTREARTRNQTCQGDSHSHDHGHGCPGGHDQHEHHHAPSAGGQGCGSFVQIIADCDVLLARRMGGGPYRALQAAGVRTVFTDYVDIDEAVAAYLAGALSVREPQLCH